MGNLEEILKGCGVPGRSALTLHWALSREQDVFPAFRFVASVVLVALRSHLCLFWGESFVDYFTVRKAFEREGHQAYLSPPWPRSLSTGQL